MRSTMQTLTNISYDGRTIDLVEEGTMTCVCNCDCLSHIAIDVYDMDGKLSPKYTALGNGYEPIAVRGEKITIDMNNNRTHGNGHDYMCVMTIFQAQQGMTENETSPGKYDVYMGSGRIQETSETATQVYIGKNISYIRPLRRDANTSTRIIGGCVIQLSDRMLLIETYDASTGIATVLSSSKVNGSTYSARPTSAGERFRLLTNYLTCDAAVFTARSGPTVSLSYTVDKKGLNVTGTYSQVNGVGIQSYKLKVEYFADVEDNVGYRLMSFEGSKKYSQTIEGTFPILGRLASSSKLGGYGLRISCEITTQENYTKTYSQGINAYTYNSEHPVTNANWTYETYGQITIETDDFDKLHIFRDERIRNDITTLWSGPQYQGYTEYDSVTGKAPFSRIAEGNGRYYRYYIYASDDEGGIYSDVYNRQGQEILGNDSICWSIRKLTDKGDHKYSSGGDEHELIYDLQPGTIETCINSQVYNAESEKPKYIHGNDNYDKGTFTVILTNEDNPDITHNKDVVARPVDIRNWQEFVSSEGPFLLKTDKGDVKIVQISSNPVRSYGSGIADIGIVKVTVGWTEVDDISKAVFV